MCNLAAAIVNEALYQCALAWHRRSGVSHKSFFTRRGFFKYAGCGVNEVHDKCRINTLYHNWSL